MPHSHPGRGAELKSLALLFLRLGATSFGGPAAHIALMRHEVVQRKHWLTDAEFLDLLGATNLIPGPNSTEMAIHIGHKRAGWPGLLLAGVSFILPAALIVTALASLYVAYGSLPQAEGILYGVKPVIILIVGNAIYALARTALKSKSLALLCAAAAVAAALGANELLILLAAGLFSQRPAASASLSVPLLTVPATLHAFGLLPLFLFFLKVGAVLFGSGYVLLAFLRTELVENWGWLTQSQLLDAIAIGQVTPGPVFTTATFIGYLLGGGPGAVVATVGIFLPAFLFVAISGPLIPGIRNSRRAGAFLDGVNAASLALMAVVALQLARSAILDPLTLAIFLAGAAALFRFRLNSTWLVAAAALAGLLAKSVGIQSN